MSTVMRLASKNTWLLASLLLTTPSLAFAQGGGEIFLGIILLILFFVAAFGLFVIWLGVYIYRRSKSVLLKTIAWSMCLPVGIYLLFAMVFGIRQAAGLILVSQYLMIPSLFVALLIGAARVNSWPVR